MMKIEKKSKLPNSLSKLQLNEELVMSSYSKRKEGPTVKTVKTKIYKRRKVKNLKIGIRIKKQNWRLI